MTIDTVWLQQRFPEIIGPQMLGRGGQKLVFSGQHVADGDVVLKLFHLGTDQERVLREIKAAQEIPSRRIPRIFEAGTTGSEIGDIIWVREQRIHGPSLREVLTVHSLSERDILTLAAHMLEALSAAEQVRIVHRDVKPDNIIAGDDGNYWLVDFGFARHLDMASLTATALPFGVGTPGYAPPEQFRNVKSEIDARADLFGLGVTMYECSEGINPFRVGARDVGEILRRVDTMILPSIQRQIDAKGQFKELVLAMTRTQVDHRPPSAAEALCWIQEICSAENQ